MTRVFVIAMVASSACGCAQTSVRPGDDALLGRDRSWSSLDAARELDQQGVRSFRQERYEDAILYFRAARDLGGPSSELWNIARCEERVDEGERASQALEEYLTQGDLLPADRAEAEHEKQALASRPSTLTVTTTPPGAAVAIDGLGAPRATPLSIEVAQGAHVLDVRRAGYASRTQPFDARFGRAVIVALYLPRADK
jgi:hypothetical protein